MADWIERFSLEGRKAWSPVPPRASVPKSRRLCRCRGRYRRRRPRRRGAGRNRRRRARAGRRCLTILAELASADGPATGGAAALAEWGTIDILVNSGSRVAHRPAQTSVFGRGLGRDDGREPARALPAVAGAGPRR